MRLIGFTANYIAPIQAGTKTMTLRKASAPRPSVGEIVGFRCRYDLPPFGYGRVLSVEPVTRSTFTDWAADGFSSRREWAKRIAERYGNAQLVAIRWEPITEVPPVEMPTTLF